MNALEITPDRSMIAAAGEPPGPWGHRAGPGTLLTPCPVLAAGYQHIRMYDLNSNNPNPVINYDGVSKNITSVGFHEDGRWMYTGGEDCMARIWDLRWAQAAGPPPAAPRGSGAGCTLSNAFLPHCSRSRNLQCQRIFQVNAPINCVCLHPNQVSTGSAGISQLLLCGVSSG